MSKHIRGVHINEKSKCPTCGKIISVTGLNHHIKSLHDKQRKRRNLARQKLLQANAELGGGDFYKLTEEIEFEDKDLE